MSYHSSPKHCGAGSGDDICTASRHTARLPPRCKSCLAFPRIGIGRSRCTTPAESTEPDNSCSSNSKEEENEVIAAPSKQRRGKVAKKDIKECTAIVKRTRSKKKKGKEPFLQALLGQAVSSQGPICVNVPYSLIELEHWKTTVGKYKDNPDKVAKLVERAINSQNPDWADVNSMSDTLLDPTERRMVNKVITSVEASIANELLQGTITQMFPLENPGWDLNIPEHMARLKQYRSLVVYGLKHGLPKIINWSKTYKVRQNYDESPTDFLSRLRETAIKYTDLDPESADGKVYLVLLFMAEATNDIRKLQKIEGVRNIDKLVEVA